MPLGSVSRLLAVVVETLFGLGTDWPRTHRRDPHYPFSASPPVPEIQTVRKKDLFGPNKFFKELFETNEIAILDMSLIELSRDLIIKFIYLFNRTLSLVRICSLLK